MNDRVQVAIVGAGPAGITAAIQLVRSGVSVLLFDKRRAGGTIEVAWRVENLPTFKSGTSGKVIANRLANHLKDFDIPVIESQVKCVRVGKTFRLETEDRIFEAENVIVACGMEHLKLEVPEFVEPYMLDLFCEPAKKNSRILIVGSGDVAFDQALKLKHKGHEVVIVHRKAEVKALKRLVQLAEKNNIQHLVSVKPEWKLKDEMVFREDLKVCYGFDYVLPCIGRDFSTLEIHTDSGMLDYRVQQNKVESDIGGLYFAGDIIRGTKRQVSIAMGDGMNAALTILAKMAE